MGVRFRKSINLGPFRFTISKTGISYSFGAKGLRITKTASGRVRTTASIPGTGVGYVKEKNISNNKKTSFSPRESVKQQNLSPSKGYESADSVYSKSAKSSDQVFSERYEGPLPDAIIDGEDCLQEAARVVIGCGGASPIILQKRMGIGYSHATRLIDKLFELGIVGPYKIGEPRDILFSPDNNGGNL